MRSKFLQLSDCDRVVRVIGVDIFLLRLTDITGIDLF